MCKSTKNGALGALFIERLTFSLMAGLALHGKGAYLGLEASTLTRYRLNPRPPPFVVRWLYAGAFLCVGISWGNWENWYYFGRIGWYYYFGRIRELDGRGMGTPSPPHQNRNPPRSI